MRSSPRPLILAAVKEAFTGEVARARQLPEQLTVATPGPSTLALRVNIEEAPAGNQMRRPGDEAAASSTIITGREERMPDSVLVSVAGDVASAGAALAGLILVFLGHTAGTFEN